MWFLALAMLNVAIDILFHHWDVEAGFIAGAFSLVFALPALRDAQPGIPEVGCFMDAIGFLWCLLVISTLACIMLFAWAYCWKPGSCKTFSCQATSSMGPDIEK
ncbi:hypothetical protein DSO57_1004598 [Entomophthora muscae]|uniref:Uncharacterized protein n=1 Tax=Entomophthora muscae TaxID=34485 RepID=A0ACC2TV54_9FUNG|nr:hypothetical protein DSO57_1004598 [Entomophthora muscae]